MFIKNGLKVYVGGIDPIQDKNWWNKLSNPKKSLTIGLVLTLPNRNGGFISCIMKL